jgi:hypothetical protein
MKNPLNILSAVVLTAAALTVLPACQAAPKNAPAGMEVFHSYTML